jgi:GT2 family glycosyltransferase
LDVSIIIVSWNTRDILRECLRSVYQETREISFEVIVIDNASSDSSAGMVKEEFPQVILIGNSENKGFAAANNQGMRLANGLYILLLNPDTIVLDGAIQKSVAFAAQCPKAAVVGVRNDRPDGTLTKNCFQFASVQNLIISSFGLHRLFPNSRFWGRERLLWWDYLTIREVDVVAGCYMLVRREAIDQVGMMDEAYFMYGEEMDWCWRFKRAGWGILYYPDAKIIHYGGLSAAQNPVGMQMEHRKSYLRFIERRQGRIARHVACSLLFLMRFLRIWYWWFRWLFSFGEARTISKQKIRQGITSFFGD